MLLWKNKSGLEYSACDITIYNIIIASLYPLYFRVCISGECIMFHFRISKKCKGKRIQTTISRPKISQPLCNSNAVCWACLLLFCLVLSGPLLTSQQAGCTQKLKELQLFDHLEQGPFFHSQQLTAPERGKTKFSWRCTAVYYQQLETEKNSGKSQEITTGTVIFKVWWLTS